MSPEAGRQLKAISKELVQAGKKARRRGKPKDWHRVRTTSRRLRGALTAFAGALDRGVQPKLARRAKAITRLPSKVRDLDVARGNMQLLAAQVDSKAERQAAREMLARLERKREKRDRALRAQLHHDRPEHKLARRLRKALRHPVTKGRGASAAADALGRSARAVLERRDAIGGWDDEDTLHALRVAVKQYRGALGAWAEAHAQVREHRAALEALQKLLLILGEHHDWSQLGRRLDCRRLALANDGARHRDLVGYEALLERARQEQKTRYELYRADLHDRLPALVGAPEVVAVPAPVRKPPARAEVHAVN